MGGPKVTLVYDMNHVMNSLLDYVHLKMQDHNLEVSKSTNLNI